MRSAVHTLRLVVELVRYGAATRNLGLVLALLLALAAAAVVTATAAVAPAALYPFL